MVSTNIGPILKADASNAANEMDLLAIDEIRNQLFGVPFAPGTDLIARDVQRARDDGIGTYNQLRVAFDLNPVMTFADITSDPTVQQQLQTTYGTVDQIDPLEGVFAEDHVAGGDVGPTIKAILADQFARLRDGDRFFYLNEALTSQELGLIAQGNTLTKVIQTNTAITNLQANVFFFKVSIEGIVFQDLNGNGVRDLGEPGVAGIVVNLLDDSGNVIATTTTNAQGHYSFNDQTGIPGTGNFTVMVMVPTGEHATTVTTHTVHIGRGGLDYDAENFGIAADL
jgi:peroxidase